MKRFIITLLFLIVLSHISDVYAQSSETWIPVQQQQQTTQGELPPGITTAVDGLLLPGVTCGMAGDKDPGKARCCVPKKADDSLITTILGLAKNIPVIGDFFPGYQEKYKVINELSKSMEPCVSGVPSTKDDLSNKSCICIKDASESVVPQLNAFCTKYFPLSRGNNEVQQCSRCMNETGGFYTAFGCIPLDVSTFITSYILTTGIGIAGGIALLCILYSAFRMQASMGNAEAIKKAQENLTACITGLIIIIFSVLILKIIGVDILRIPGLG